MAKDQAWRVLIRTLEENPKETSEDDVSPDSCGHCGVTIDRASHMDGKKPGVGDFSVCAMCVGVNRFDASMRLVKVTDEELEGLGNEVDLDSLADVRALFRAAHLTRDRQTVKA